MYIDVHIDMCAAVYIDICMDVCIDVRVDMCMHMPRCIASTYVLRLCLRFVFVFSIIGVATRIHIDRLFHLLHLTTVTSSVYSLPIKP